MSLKDIKIKENERVLRVLYRYGLTLWWYWLSGFLFIALSLSLMFALFEKGVWGQVGFALLFGFGTFVLLRTYFIWRGNVCIITSDRVVDVHQDGLFKRVISEVPMDRIEEVTSVVQGIFGNMFKYGSVTIRTTDERVGIVIDYVRRPTNIQQMIQQMMDRYIQKQATLFSANITASIIDKLHELDPDDLEKVSKALARLRKKN